MTCMQTHFLHIAQPTLRHTYFEYGLQRHFSVRSTEIDLSN